MNKSNVIGFHHFNIKAENFEQTVDFYKSLGFERLHTWSLPEFNITECTMMFHTRAKIYVEICDKNANMPTQGRLRQEFDPYIENSILHICFIVEDAIVAYDDAIKCGAKHLSKLTDIDLFDVSSGKLIKARNTLVYSPNGEVIEFLEKDPFLIK